MKNFPSGQALVEYALILVLVTMAVIAVLALLGPSISQAFNNVTNQLNPQWTFCVNEHQTCSFSGTRQVRYGKNGHWFYGTFTNSVQCENSIFGDPLVGTVKECDIR
jgi:Flp pilus assembly pilin Flp